MQAWKLGPALAPGNLVVMMVAEQTPLTAIYMSNLTKEAGFPLGVVNIVPGIVLPSIPMRVWTKCHTKAPLRVATVGSSNLKRVTLELGERGPKLSCQTLTWTGLWIRPTLPCPSTRASAVEQAPRPKCMRNSYRTVGLGPNLRPVGIPFHCRTEQGPQVNETQFNKIFDCMKSGQQEGLKLLCGGGSGAECGYFFPHDHCQGRDLQTSDADPQIQDHRGGCGTSQ